MLTGFLGAGKTTLLNRLIAARAAGPTTAGKLAIIVNELGLVGVDGDLLAHGTARQVELPGGCVCCVLADDLDREVQAILDRNPDVDTLVLETTGVAEPLPIVWTLERPPLSDRLRVAAIVTLVDPTSFAQARALSVAAEIQVEAADVLMLTKADLATDDARRATTDALTALAPATPLVEGTPDALVAWLLRAMADPEPATRRSAPSAPHDHDHDNGHGHDSGHDHDHGHDHCDDPDHDHHPAHDHDAPAPDGTAQAHGVTAVAVAALSIVDLEQLEDELAALPPGYFRIKGIVQAIDPRRGEHTAGWSVVHRVGARVSSEPVAAPREPGRLVALGAGVAPAALLAALAAAAWK